eukprot:Em0003g823a
MYMRDQYIAVLQAAEPLYRPAVEMVFYEQPFLSTIVALCSNQVNLGKFYSKDAVKPSRHFEQFEKCPQTLPLVNMVVQRPYQTQSDGCYTNVLMPWDKVEMGAQWGDQDGPLTCRSTSVHSESAPMEFHDTLVLANPWCLDSYRFCLFLFALIVSTPFLQTPPPTRVHGPIINATCSGPQASPHNFVLHFSVVGWVLSIPVFTYAQMLHPGIPSLTHPIKQKKGLHWFMAAIFGTTLFCYMTLGIVVSLWFRGDINETASLNWAKYLKGIVPSDPL